jgi:outer membrane protein OmpA-like peptidoglycan-associated protein
MNIANFTGSVSYGFWDRADVFVSWDAITRVDRDSRPLFVTDDPQRGGHDVSVPYAREQWSGNKIGDLRVGAKFLALDESAGSPVSASAAVALRVPTGKAEDGAGAGAMGLDVSATVSRWFNKKVVLTGTAGYLINGDPDDPVEVTVPSHFRYGAGVGVAPWSWLLLHSEFTGAEPMEDISTLSAPLIGSDGSISPLVSDVDYRSKVSAGFTLFVPNTGFFGGIVGNWDYPARERVAGQPPEDNDYTDWQVRIGWSPRRTPPPAPVAPPPPAPAPPANRPPTVKANCDPCTVEVGTRSQLSADANDPDGDPLTYSWTAPAGTVEQPTIVKPMWLAPMVEGPVPVTVTVNDGKGGTASDTVTIQVIRKVQKTFTFEDVHFDFDRYTLRPEAMRVLEQALAAMKENPTLRLTLEGHTCSIGTSEYNLALGERRSNAVRDYLTSNGVGADRVTSVSYGEERPKHDNSREETRRLNRRAALVVRLDAAPQ